MYIGMMLNNQHTNIILRLYSYKSSDCMQARIRGEGVRSRVPWPPTPLVYQFFFTTVSYKTMFSHVPLTKGDFSYSFFPAEFEILFCSTVFLNSIFIFFRLVFNLGIISRARNVVFGVLATKWKVLLWRTKAYIRIFNWLFPQIYRIDY